MTAVMTRGTQERATLERLGLRPSDAQAGGRLTLEQRLDSVWEGLRAGGAPDCPVCRVPLRPGGRTGHCSGCGSIIS
jgi:hypothetical protein